MTTDDIVREVARAMVRASRPSRDPDKLVPGPRGTVGTICLWQSYEHLARAAVETAQGLLMAKLQDPAAVHLNMLRGEIAKPSPQNIWHIYGEQLLDCVPPALPRARQPDDGRRVISKT